MTNESEVVSRFLSTKNIHLPSSNDWLDGCIEWFKSQQENYSTSELQKFALQQWLLADLKMISHGSLPPNLSDINSIMLTGTYPMQINYFFNVGESAYSQYEKMRKLCLDDQQIGAETQASWMPKPKRMLKMEITDGVQTIQGFEYSYLTKLNESMEPGLKVVVKGPVECRKGVLLLKDNNIEILGGELDTLVESNPVAHIIAEKLQFDPNVVKNNIAQTDNTTQLFSQVNVGNENRAPNTNHMQPVDERNLLDSDDDDIFLSVQPDNDTANLNNVTHRNNPAPTSQSTSNGHFETVDLLDDDIDIPFENGDIYENNVATNLNNSRMYNERDWSNDARFDISDDIVETTPSFPSTSYPQSHSSSSSSRNTEPVSSKSVSRPPSMSTVASDNKTSASLVRNTTSQQPSMTSSSVTRRTNEERIETIPIERTMTVNCKVEKWKSKLMVQDGNWNLKVSLLIIGQKIVDASFEVDVLNKLIGFSYAEMLARNREMAVNPALKEMFEKIFKAAQLSIKNLKCKMTLQKSSDGESFTIIDVDES
ncbi:recQ-mediated genome instability protein 1-like [Nilaparvata lugens]|uniref:recQ-mediated genome instability protein 1-like n=1 Tax=Nilaparvata lugens TaxID=108931 RepID=UPI00193D589E|nr:recQ-mediated genome instability protein 1-like [Nilaparvata lugens]